MSRLPLDLPARLRAWGLTVVEVDGWQTRGKPTLTPLIVIRHHTAGSSKGEIPSLRILVNGRSDLPGPLCQVALGRSGTVHIVASGKANHAGDGRWNDVDGGASDNSKCVGVEAENDGYQPWPQVQLDAWDRLDACLLETIGAPPRHLCSHREWAIPSGRKVDPHSMPMAVVRDRVARLLSRGPAGTTTPTEPTPPTEENEMNDAERTQLAETHAAAARMEAAAARLEAILNDTVVPALGRVDADTDGLPELVARSTPEQVADATPDGIAQAVVDLLTQRLAG